MSENFTYNTALINQLEKFLDENPISNTIKKKPSDYI